MLRQEREILAHAASLPEEERERPPPPADPELKQKLLAAVDALQGEGCCAVLCSAMLCRAVLCCAAFGGHAAEAEGAE
jgi:hypothetical protein